MKKGLFFTIVFVLILTLYGCEPRIRGLELVSLPDKTEYVAGVDTQLDLTGGVVRYTFLFPQGDDYELCNMDELTVIENIDFNTPGTYDVRIFQHNDAWVDFDITVIDP